MIIIASYISLGCVLATIFFLFLAAKAYERKNDETCANLIRVAKVIFFILAPTWYATLCLLAPNNHPDIGLVCFSLMFYWLCAGLSVFDPYGLESFELLKERKPRPWLGWFTLSLIVVNVLIILIWIGMKSILALLIVLSFVAVIIGLCLTFLSAGKKRQTTN